MDLQPYGRASDYGFGEGRERQLAGFGQRLSLVQADKESGLPEDNPLMGLFQAYILPDIQEKDWERVGQAEFMSIEVFPTLNERLYLCFLHGKMWIQS